MSRHIALIAGSSQQNSQSAKVAHWLAASLQARDCETSVIELGQQPLPLWPEADSNGRAAAACEMLVCSAVCMTAMNLTT